MDVGLDEIGNLTTCENVYGQSHPRFTTVDPSRTGAPYIRPYFQTKKLNAFHSQGNDEEGARSWLRPIHSDNNITMFRFPGLHFPFPEQINSFQLC